MSVDKRDKGGSQGKTFPPRQGPTELTLAFSKPTAEKRASILFPAAVKEAHRQVLVLYKEHAGLGDGQLRNAIMKDEDERFEKALAARVNEPGLDPQEILTKSHIAKWLKKTHQPGDNTFQYIDRFVRQLDFDELGREAKRILRKQNFHSMRDALTRFYQVQSYGDLPQLKIFEALSFSVHGGLFAQLHPPSATSKETATFHPVVILLFIGEIIDGFAEAHVTATFIDDLTPVTNPAVAEILHARRLELSRTLRLYSGYIIATSPPDEEQDNYAWGLLLLRSVSDAVPFETKLYGLKAPDAYADMFGTFRIEVTSKRPTKTSFRLRFPNDLNRDYENPQFRPWHRRTSENYTPYWANEWLNISPTPDISRIVAEFDFGWRL